MQKLRSHHLSIIILAGIAAFIIYAPYVFITEPHIPRQQALTVTATPTGAPGSTDKTPAPTPVPSPAPTTVPAEYQYSSDANPYVARLKIRLQETLLISESAVDELLSDARLILIPQPPPPDKTEKKPCPGWENYDHFNRPWCRFLGDVMARRGYKFITAHQDTFTHIEERYEVSPHMLAALIGVETDYGQTTYTTTVYEDGVRRPHYAFNVFYSQLFWDISSAKKNFAIENIVALIAFLPDSVDDPYDLRSSSGGAFGISQFLPHSYMRYAVDGNNDGLIDLFDVEDALASAGNYLYLHGWRADDPASHREALRAYWGAYEPYSSVITQLALHIEELDEKP